MVGRKLGEAQAAGRSDTPPKAKLGDHSSKSHANEKDRDCERRSARERIRQSTNALKKIYGGRSGRGRIFHTQG